MAINHSFLAATHERVAGGPAVLTEHGHALAALVCERGIADWDSLPPSEV
jgi:hypothetical protein